jgi:hypothetical protein
VISAALQFFLQPKKVNKEGRHWHKKAKRKGGANKYKNEIDLFYSN